MTRPWFAALRSKVFGAEPVVRQGESARPPEVVAGTDTGVAEPAAHLCEDEEGLAAWVDDVRHDRETFTSNSQPSPDAR